MDYSKIVDSEILQNIKKRKSDLNDIQVGIFDRRISQCLDIDRLRALMILTQRLNPQQFEAAIHDHDTDNQLLIIAGAGSGKTAVLTRRIVFLMLWGAAPDRIFAVTFTNKAAGEMKERVKLLLEDIIDTGSNSFKEEVQKLIDAVPSMWVSTFHSVCLKILRDSVPGDERANIERLGYTKRFIIVSEQDKRNIVKDCMAELQIKDESITSDDILSEIAICKNELIYPDEYINKNSGSNAAIVGEVYKKYQEKLLQKKAIDFDDMIFFVSSLLKDDEDVRDYYQERFEYVLVDEYQDTNFSQYVMAIILSEKYQKVFVVGDDDQSIYGWRGADIRNILNFRKDFPSAKIIKLERNYRSTGKILDVANNVFLNKPADMRKVLKITKKDDTGQDKMGEHIVYYNAKDEIDEMQFVTYEIKQLVEQGKNRYIDCAILYRVNEQKDIFKKFFTRHKLPFIEVGDNRALSRKEINDILMVFDLIDVFIAYQQNPDNISHEYLERIADNYLNFLKWPIFRLSDDEKVMLDHFKDKYKILVDENEFNKLFSRLSEMSQKSLNKMNEIINDLVQDIANNVSVSQMIDNILEYTKYYFLNNYSSEAEKRYSVRMMNKFKDIATVFELTNEINNPFDKVRLFIDDVNEKKSGTQFSAEDKDGVQFLTLHSAKGLEFPVVFFIGLDDGIVPHFYGDTKELPKSYVKKVIEEERRLFYVGVTRAQERLYLIHATTRFWGGKKIFFKPSRYLKTVPKNILEKGDYTKNIFGKIKSKFELFINFLKT